MYNHFRERYPNLTVSYQKFIAVFNEKFNIKFGFPRTDTCSVCDEFLAEVESLKKKLTNIAESDNQHKIIEKKIKDLTTANSVHKLKAEVFYTRKRMARKKSEKCLENEAIAMDYQKNLSLPNVTSNDVYYRR